jgi:hypothetical protein
MNNTLFYDDHEKIVKDRAYSFYESPEGLKKSVLSYANAGATSLFTTAEDLTKWANNFYTIKAGNASVIKQMHQRGILNKGDTITYAFGQAISKYKGVKIVSHSGGDAGYRSFLLRFPEQKYSIVVLSNFGSFNPGSLAYKIADIGLKDILKNEQKEEVKVANGKFKVSEALLKLYEGEYQLTPEMIITFKIDKGELTAQATGQPVIALTASSESDFFFDAAGIKVSFPKVIDNTVNQFTLYQGGQTIVAPRMKSFDLKSISLASYVGKYYSSELQTSYDIELKDSNLRAVHIRHEPTDLSIVGKDAFSTDTWFMSKIDFTRGQTGEVDGLKVSSGRVKNVTFKKVP